ncbi:hypothetical protein F5148DRAFT_1173812 [Russula earlei]|uniref:Uncharacterized protein n=1 Tax=Russula earlei TaxID=71964 RepID=A0ACC0UHZ0_9AGAM|nr:hypothetical protein F5148DRAFT_1173812 [Russula earlei]
MRTSSIFAIFCFNMGIAPSFALHSRSNIKQEPNLKHLDDMSRTPMDQGHVRKRELRKEMNAEQTQNQRVDASVGKLTNDFHKKLHITNRHPDLASDMHHSSLDSVQKKKYDIDEIEAMVALKDFAELERKARMKELSNAAHQLLFMTNDLKKKGVHG